MHEKREGCITPSFKYCSCNTCFCYLQSNPNPPKNPGHNKQIMIRMIIIHHIHSKPPHPKPNPTCLLSTILNLLVYFAPITPELSFGVNTPYPKTAKAPEKKQEQDDEPKYSIIAEQTSKT